MKTFLLFTFLLSSLLGLTADIKPADQVREDFIQHYNQLIIAVNQLNETAQSVQVDWKKNRTAFYTARIAFKRVEMIMSYLDPEFVKDHINGAPLPHTERKAPNLVVIAPSGFQIIDETIIEQNLTDFRKLSSKLNLKVTEFQQYLSAVKLTERMVFESMRLELVRVAALGITGFDTPSEVNALKEAETAMLTLKKTIAIYNRYLSVDQVEKVTSIFLKSEAYFNENNFAEFNRFGFIKDVINELYKTLLHYQKSLQIETRDLTTDLAFSTNYSAENIFDTDFLNFKYYSKYSSAGVEEERIELGKTLFFDPILSGNNERACASCHHPDLAFTDGQKTSIAFNKTNQLQRNSPTLMNSVFNTRFFWDARATTPEDQIEHVLFNPDELNSNYEALIEKLNTSTVYITEFKKAYPELQDVRSKPISRYTIVASITAYIQSLRSFNSQFDQAIKGERKPANQQIETGFNIFTGKGKCATCHFIPTFAGNVPPLYIDTETEVLAVPAINNFQKAEIDSDMGRYANGRPHEKTDYNKNAFKTPSLRNIALTAPYMHNGVFNTLDEVIEFYNIGGGHAWGIAPENTTLAPDSLHLSTSEIQDLIIFLEALTDTAGFTNAPKSLPKSATLSLNQRIIGGKY